MNHDLNQSIYITPNNFFDLSNLAPNYGVLINKFPIASAEHLYHALKFSDNFDIQQLIIESDSTKSARRTASSIKLRQYIRKDFEDIKLDIMQYCLHAKMIWNWVKFGNLLKETGASTIVDVSRGNDIFWGTNDKSTEIVGENQLGKLITQLRDDYLNGDNSNLRVLTAPEHLNLRLFGKQIQPIDRTKLLRQVGTIHSAEVAWYRS